MARDRANDETPAAGPSAEGPSPREYFRRLFAEHPDWLTTRSNDLIIDRWLRDHPGHAAMPLNVRNTLANLKSTLRKQLGAAAEGTAPPARRSSRGLEQLALRIDACLARARELDPIGMDSIIELLRRARNAVLRARKK